MERLPSDHGRLGSQHERHCAGKVQPGGCILMQMLPARRSQAVEPRPTLLVSERPARRYQPAILEPAKRRIERALLDLQCVAAYLANPSHDAIAVQLLAYQRLENQQAECSLQHSPGFSSHCT